MPLLSSLPAPNPLKVPAEVLEVNIGRNTNRKVFLKFHAGFCGIVQVCTDHIKAVHVEGDDKSAVELVFFAVSSAQRLQDAQEEQMQWFLVSIVQPP
jgi:hypothetical protein